jgi:acyl-CoA thioester hydrolase
MTNNVHTPSATGRPRAGAELSITDFPHTTVVTTRWKDNDVNGHVNNVEYYSYFDTAICEFLVNRDWREADDGETVAVCAESGCRFINSLSFPDRVRAGLRVSRLGRTSVVYQLGLFNDRTETLAAEGFFVHVFVGRKDRRPTQIPRSIRAALTQIEVTEQ